MHPALCISEILFNIFGHCRTDDGNSDLFSLARTCCTFKEPALDLLWEELGDSTPLAACLPERKNAVGSPLTQAEWNTLRSYTYRIRSIRNFRKPLDRESFKFLSETHMASTLFPNLRFLQFKYTAKATPLLHLALPSLISLYIELDDLRSFQHHLNSFPSFSPNLQTLSFRVNHRGDHRGALFDPNYIIRWQNLQIVDCPQVTLQLDTLVHLSGMPALTRLAFMLDTTLSEQIASSNSRPVFPDLRHLTLNSILLGPVSRFLSLVQLPVTTNLVACIGHCPGKQVLAFFFNSIQTCGAGHTIQKLQVTQSLYSSRFREHTSLSFGLDDLLPCMAFSDLRRIELNIDWTASLTDRELSTLAPAWPHLESLLINRKYEWGWDTATAGGITSGA